MTRDLVCTSNALVPLPLFIKPTATLPANLPMIPMIATVLNKPTHTPPSDNVNDPLLPLLLFIKPTATLPANLSLIPTIATVLNTPTHSPQTDSVKERLTVLKTTVYQACLSNPLPPYQQTCPQSPLYLTNLTIIPRVTAWNWKTHYCQYHCSSNLPIQGIKKAQSPQWQCDGRPTKC